MNGSGFDFTVLTIRKGDPILTDKRREVQEFHHEELSRLVMSIIQKTGKPVLVEVERER